MEAVSAAVAYVQTGGTLVLHDELAELRSQNRSVQVVAGVDMRITSADGLRHLLDLGVETYVYRAHDHSFHGKTVVLSDSTGPREAFIGSANWTFGGLVLNSEFTMHVQARSSADRKQLLALAQEVDVLRTNARRVRVGASLRKAVRDFRIPSEAKGRSRASDRRPGERPSIATSALSASRSPLLSEAAVAYQRRAFQRNVSAQRRVAGVGGGSALPSEVPAGADADRLVCTLNEVRSPNTPGEVRLPVSALHASPAFWSYPAAFSETHGGKRGRVTFHERRVRCRFTSAGRQDTVAPDVRIYYYVERGEFRVTSHEFRERAAADDIAIFSFAGGTMLCRLVDQNDPEYSQLLPLCINVMPAGGARARPRVWGFA